MEKKNSLFVKSQMLVLMDLAKRTDLAISDSLLAQMRKHFQTILLWSQIRSLFIV